MSIHPTACLSAQSELAEGVQIGPHCILSGKVRLGRNVRLVGHVYLNGPVAIGDDTTIYPFAAIGFPAQDFKFNLGDPTAGVVIGPRSIIRENVTVHASTHPEIPTRIGERIFMMAGSHIGHDAQVGNNVVMVNTAAVAGHAMLGDNVTLGGGAMIHQHTRIGRLVFFSGLTGASMDVPPFCLVPERNRAVGLNLVGMRRAGMPREHITLVRRAFREAIRPCLQRNEMLEVLEDIGRDCPPVLEMAQFVRESKRAIIPGTGRIPRMFTTWVHMLRRGQTSAVGAPEDDDWPET